MGFGRSVRRSGIREQNLYAPFLYLSSWRLKDYTVLRLKKAKQFYQARVPRYVRQRSVCQFVIFLSAAASAVLAFASFPSVVAVVSFMLGDLQIRPARLGQFG
jgi:hypothetical protein